MHAPHLPCTRAGYLALDAAEPDRRYEFWDGEVSAMGGASRAHNAVALGFAAELRRALRGSPCAAFMADMRTRIAEDRYVYPDVVVACPPELDESARPETLVNPRVVVEVLSPSTEAFDRGRKFAGYREVASLTDYVLAAADTARVEHYSREPDGRWSLRTLGPGERLELAALGVTLALDEVYAELPV